MKRNPASKPLTITQANPPAASFLPRLGNTDPSARCRTWQDRIRFQVGSFGVVQASFTLDDLQLGDPSGGTILSLLEEIMGWPIALQTGRLSWCAEMRVRFLEPLAAGGAFTASAYPGHKQGRFWIGEAELRDDRNQAIIRADGKYFLYSQHQMRIALRRLRFRPGDAPVFRYGVSYPDAPREPQGGQPWGLLR